MISENCLAEWAPAGVQIGRANYTSSHEEIRLRAYEIHLERGGLPGNELDDWLQDERELARTAPPKAQGLAIKGDAQ